MHQEHQQFKRTEFPLDFFQERSFTNCIFDSCRFEKSQWRHTKFSECIFKNCDLSLVKVDACRLHNTLFKECKIIGIEFYKCDKTLFSLQLQHCIAMSCNFSEMKMKKSSFQGSKIIECYFDGTQLMESNFRETDLQRTIFRHCDLSQADFSEAKNYSIDPQSNILRKALFTLPEALSLLNFFDIKIR